MIYSLLNNQSSPESFIDHRTINDLSIVSILLIVFTSFQRNIVRKIARVIERK